jgi:hypothetical protein
MWHNSLKYSLTKRDLASSILRHSTNICMDHLFVFFDIQIIKLINLYFFRHYGSIKCDGKLRTATCKYFNKDGFTYQDSEETA